MKLTEKQLCLIMLLSIFLLHGFDSWFLPNTTFSIYTLACNIFIAINTIGLTYTAISNWKSNSKKDILGYIVTLTLCLLMFNVVNF